MDWFFREHFFEVLLRIHLPFLPRPTLHEPWKQTHPINLVYTSTDCTPRFIPTQFGWLNPVCYWWATCWRSYRLIVPTWYIRLYWLIPITKTIEQSKMFFFLGSQWFPHPPSTEGETSAEWGGWSYEARVNLTVWAGPSGCTEMRYKVVPHS